MNSIVWTYPDFQDLPRGIKQMLVASEAHFFREARQEWSSAVLEKLKSGAASKPPAAGEFMPGRMSFINQLAFVSVPPTRQQQMRNR